MSDVVRLALPSDAAAMLEIYAPIVRATAISFELEPPSTEDYRARVETNAARFPWIVREIDGEIAGFAHGGAFRPRPAYQWTVETTVYVRETARRRRVAGSLYEALLEALRIQGFQTAVAVIALPNEASVALHEGFGFRRVGGFPAVGFKLGRWHDVGWWTRPLGRLPAVPAQPRPIAEVCELPAWRALFAAPTND